MDRSILISESFDRRVIPDYKCPRCGSHLQSKMLREEDRASSKQGRHVNGHDHEDEYFVFFVQFECSHPACGEPVFLTGESHVTIEYLPDGVSPWKHEYVTWCRPRYFIPHLSFFEIPEKTPIHVAESIKASFNIFFVSTGSALNEVRNSIEYLLDELGIPRKEKSRLTLEARIKRLSGEYESHKLQLLAVKNIGNWGTHGEHTTRKDILNAYAILAHVLEAIYTKRDAYIAQLVGKVDEEDKRRKSL